MIPSNLTVGSSELGPWNISNALPLVQISIYPPTAFCKYLLSFLATVLGARDTKVSKMWSLP